MADNKKNKNSQQESFARQLAFKSENVARPTTEQHEIEFIRRVFTPPPWAIYKNIQ